MIYRRWSLHGFGHMLGLDIHDCVHARPKAYGDGILRENYVLTMEPGLCLQPHDELVPEELRGIGVGSRTMPWSPGTARACCRRPCPPRRRRSSPGWPPSARRVRGSGTPMTSRGDDTIPQVPCDSAGREEAEVAARRLSIEVPADLKRGVLHGYSGLRDMTALLRRVEAEQQDESGVRGRGKSHA
jgi:hypothetical protein